MLTACSPNRRNYVEVLPKKELLWEGLESLVPRGSEKACCPHTAGPQSLVAKCPCVAQQGTCYPPSPVSLSEPRFPYL